MIISKISKATGGLNKEHLKFGNKETEYFFDLSARDFNYSEYFVNFENKYEKKLFYMIFAETFYKEIDENLIKLNEISAKEDKYKNDFSRMFRTFQIFIRRLERKTGLEINNEVEKNGAFKIIVTVNKLYSTFHFDKDYELISERIYPNSEDLPDFFTLEELIEIQKLILSEVYRFGRYQKSKK